MTARRNDLYTRLRGILPAWLAYKITVRMIK